LGFHLVHGVAIVGEFAVQLAGNIANTDGDLTLACFSPDRATLRYLFCGAPSAPRSSPIFFCNISAILVSILAIYSPVHN
jgi:hypothetical protein